MQGFLTVLPLAFVMLAGPQIISAVFLATSEEWRRNSAAFLAGVLLAVTFFVTLAYVVGKLLKGGVGDSHKEGVGQGMDIAIILLLVAAGGYVFLNRHRAEPPRWMGRLQTATPKLSFTLGLLLLGVFPTDILTSTTVGFHLARNDDPWWHCLPFILATLFLASVPALLVLLLGKRAVAFLPKVRDWMNTNSWIVSEIVIAFFIGVEVDSLVG